MSDIGKNANEALKEIQLQKILLESLGITVSELAKDEDINYVVNRVGNTCFAPYDSITVYAFNYEGWYIGGSKLYAHDTGDCVIVIELKKRILPTEVIRQLLLLGYTSDNPNWIGYKKRVY